jgi:hypothetical protein
MLDKNRGVLLEKAERVFLRKGCLNKVSDISKPKNEPFFAGVIADALNFSVEVKPFEKSEYLILLFRERRIQDYSFLQFHVVSKGLKFTFNGIFLIPQLIQAFLRIS